jgi:hypothetical protein
MRYEMKLIDGELRMTLTPDSNLEREFFKEIFVGTSVDISTHASIGGEITLTKKVKEDDT